MNQDDNILTVTLSPGQIIKINGIPFRLESEAKISGNKRNFVIANLVRDETNVGIRTEIFHFD